MLTMILVLRLWSLARGLNDETVRPPRKRAVLSPGYGQKRAGSVSIFLLDPRDLRLAASGDILLFNPSPHCATEPWYESDDPGWFSVRSGFVLPEQEHDRSGACHPKNCPPVTQPHEKNEGNRPCFNILVDI